MVVFSRKPRHMLKIFILGGAVLGLMLIAFAVSSGPGQPTPARAALSVQSDAQYACQTTINSNVPSSAIPIASQEGCNTFSLSIVEPAFLPSTKITVCPQAQKPPLIWGQDYTYDHKHCVSWGAQDSRPHSIAVPRRNPPAGYVISFTSVDKDEEYQIKAVIQQ